jgi:MFS family permease
MTGLSDVTQNPASQGGKVFYGWWVVLTAGLGLGLGYSPIIVYSFSLFLKPLISEFHSGRADLSLAFSLANISLAITSPAVGRWADRLGSRRVILFATIAFASVLIAALIPFASLWQLYLLYVALGGSGSGTAPVPYGKIIASWFNNRRGLALGLAMFGLGSGAILMPLLAQRLITTLGWRGAYASIGLVNLLVSVPAIGLFLKEPLANVGSPSDARADAATPPEGVTWSDAWHDRAFWLMVGSFLLVGVSVQGCVVHLVPMLTDRGITSERAALASSLLGLALLIGRVSGGYALDRFFAPHVAACFLSGLAMGITLFWSGAAGVAAYLAAFLVGLAVGAEVDIIAYLTSRYFGLRAFGQIYGYAFASFALASALGPWIMGVVFDRTDSYRAVLACFSLATLLAAILILRLGPYRYRPPMI